MKYLIIIFLIIIIYYIYNKLYKGINYINALKGIDIIKLLCKFSIVPINAKIKPLIKSNIILLKNIFNLKNITNNAYICLSNGLGDKLLDLVGFYIICKYLNYNPIVGFNHTNVNHEWGNTYYDTNLFNFNNIIIDKNNDNNYYYYVYSIHTGLSLSPYKVYSFLKTILPNITFKEISKKYILYSKEIIKPSDIILSKIPKEIEKAYGLHLRRSDKVKKSKMAKIESNIENSINEFNIIIEKLLDEVKYIILNKKEPIFLIVSEENEWKCEIEEIINNFAIKNNKKIKILNIDYTNNNNNNNNNSILDMFCLSKCKKILQGVKYSSFSIISSMIGSNNLSNYTKYLNDNNDCSIYAWNSILNINNKKIYDIEKHKRYINIIPDLDTNIIEPFILT